MKELGHTSASARNSLEAGDLSRGLSRAQVEIELARREAVLRAASRAAERFLGGDWRQAMPDLLRELGQGTDVSRVYLFENQTAPDGGIHPFQRYEWCAPGIEPQIDNPELQEFAFADVGLKRWQQELSNDAVVQGDIAELPAGERPSLEAQNILSILVVPVTVSGHWWGLIGFDECRQTRVWQPAEVETLRLSADILAAAIARESSENALRDSESEMTALFAAMRDPVFVIGGDGVYRKVFAHDEGLLALPREELIGRSASEVFSPQVATQFLAVLDDVIRHRQLHKFQYPLTINGQQMVFGERHATGGKTACCGSRATLPSRIWRAKR